MLPRIPSSGQLWKQYGSYGALVARVEMTARGQSEDECPRPTTAWSITIAPRPEGLGCDCTRPAYSGPHPLSGPGSLAGLHPLWFPSPTDRHFGITKFFEPIRLPGNPRSLESAACRDLAPLANTSSKNHRRGALIATNPIHLPFRGAPWLS